MDALHGVLKWIDHDRWKAAGLLLALLITAVLVGCPIKTASVLRPRERVTPLGLKQEAAVIQAEYAGKMELVQLGVEDIEDQRALREKVAGVLAGTAQAAATGTITPLGGLNAGITLLATLVGVGAVLDKRRANGVIAELKKPPAEPDVVG